MALSPLLKKPIQVEEFMARFNTPLEASAPGGMWALDLPVEFRLVMTTEELRYDRLDWEVPVDVFTFTLGILRDEWDVKSGYTEGQWQWKAGPISGKLRRELMEGKDPRKYPVGSDRLDQNHEITSSAEINVLFPKGYHPVAYVSSIQGEELHLRMGGGALYGCEGEMLEEATHLRDEAVEARDKASDKAERTRFNRYRRHFDRMIRMLSKSHPQDSAKYFLHANRGVLPPLAGLHVCHDAGIPAYAIGVDGDYVGDPPKFKPYRIYQTTMELLADSSNHNVAVAGVEGYALQDIEAGLAQQCSFKLKKK